MDLSCLVSNCRTVPPWVSDQACRWDNDGLRAVAVLSVIFFHAFPQWMRGGFVGVDIFFVISGYLISGIIFKGLERGSFSLREFYERRVIRVFPTLIVVLVSVLILGWFLLLGFEYKQLSGYAIAGTLFYSNLLSWLEAGYFDANAAVKPLLHCMSSLIFWSWILFLYFVTGNDAVSSETRPICTSTITI